MSHNSVMSYLDDRCRSGIALPDGACVLGGGSLIFGNLREPGTSLSRSGEGHRSNMAPVAVGVMGVKSEGAGDGNRGYIYNLKSLCFVEPCRCYSVNTNPITSSL